MSVNESVQNDGLISDESLRDWVRDEIHRCLHIERRLTREQLSANSRINVWTIDEMLDPDRRWWAKLRPSPKGPCSTA